MALKEMGLKDIGFGCTVSKPIPKDMLSLYQLQQVTRDDLPAAFFITRTTFIRTTMSSPARTRCAVTLRQLIEWQLKRITERSWFRAWFNMGLINYIEGGRRMLPCRAEIAVLWNPFGDVFYNRCRKKYWKVDGEYS